MSNLEIPNNAIPNLVITNNVIPKISFAIMKKGTYMQPVTEAVKLQTKLQVMLNPSGSGPEPGTTIDRP